MDHVGQIGERLRRGEYVQARRLAEAVLGLEDGTIGEKAQAACLGAEAAYRLDDIQAAIALARRAVDLATEAGDCDTMGRGLFRLCGALIVAGDSPMALEAAEQFLAGLQDRWPHLEAELAAKMHTNLGLIYRTRRRYPEAMQAYWQALVRFQSARDVEGEIRCRQQLSWLLLDLAELDEAEEHLTQASALLSPDVPGYVVPLQLTVEAVLRLEQGRFTEALELAHEVLTPGRPDVNADNKAVALYVAGMCSLRSGQAPTARMFLQMAREAAIQSGLASVMNMVQKLHLALIEQMHE